MTTKKEIRAIKNVVLSVVERLEEIKGLYLKEQTGDILSVYKSARSEEKKLDSVAIQFVTKTRVTIALQIKLDKRSNASVIYRKLKRMITEDLKEIKYNLIGIDLTVVDVE